MHNSNVRFSGTLGLLQMMGFAPSRVTPGELLPSELILLGALSVREAQLVETQQHAANAVMTMLDVMRQSQDNAQYISELEDSNDVLLRLLREEQGARSEERKLRIDAENRFAQLRIRVEGLTEGLDSVAEQVNSLADEAVDACAEADEDDQSYGMHATG